VGHDLSGEGIANTSLDGELVSFKTEAGLCSKSSPVICSNHLALFISLGSDPNSRPATSPDFQLVLLWCEVQHNLFLPPGRK
jgi:hypothetical protein